MRGDYHGVSDDEELEDDEAAIGNRSDGSESALVGNTHASRKPYRSHRPPRLIPTAGVDLRPHKARESPATSPTKASKPSWDREGRRRANSQHSDDGARALRSRKLRENNRRSPSAGRRRSAASASLTPEAIARLNQENAELERKRQKEEAKLAKQQSKRRADSRGRGRGGIASGMIGSKKASGKRLVSGAYMEEGRGGELAGLRGGSRSRHAMLGAGGGGDDGF
ncbi:hypothetical protein KEM55_007707 [Ascosphaera atra]|nr:hypothetical protein KEM55_007707 [Ascosphaera atra]